MRRVKSISFQAGRESGEATEQRAASRSGGSGIYSRRLVNLQETPSQRNRRAEERRNRGLTKEAGSESRSWESERE